MSKSNADVALEFLDAMDHGDPDRAARCLTADAYTVSKGFGKVSGRRDRAAMLGTMKAFRQMVPTGFRPKMQSVTATAERVVLEFEGDAVLSNGKPYCNQYCFVFTFKDGLISQLNEYFCTVLADEAILPLLAQQGSEVAWT